MSLTREQELQRAAFQRLRERIAATPELAAVTVRDNARSMTLTAPHLRSADLVVLFAQAEGLRATPFVEGVTHFVIVR